MRRSWPLDIPSYAIEQCTFLYPIAHSFLVIFFPQSGSRNKELDLSGKRAYGELAPLGGSTSARGSSGPFISLHIQKINSETFSIATRCCLGRGVALIRLTASVKSGSTTPWTKERDKMQVIERSSMRSSMYMWAQTDADAAVCLTSRHLHRTRFLPWSWDLERIITEPCHSSTAKNEQTGASRGKSR